MLVLSFFFYARVLYRLTAINASGKTRGEAPRQTRDYVLVFSSFFYARVLYRLTAINSSGKTRSSFNDSSEAPLQNSGLYYGSEFFVIMP